MTHFHAIDSVSAFKWLSIAIWAIINVSTYTRSKQYFSLYLIIWIFYLDLTATYKKKTTDVIFK